MKKNVIFENLLASLTEQLTRALRDPGWPENSLLCSLSLKLELPVSTQLSDPGGDFFYSAQPDTQRFRLGRGCAYRYQTDEPEADKNHSRLAALQQAFRNLQTRWALFSPDSSVQASQPAAFVGFAYAAEDSMSAPWRNWPNTLMIVPSVLLQQDGAAFTLHLSAKTDLLRTLQQRVRQRDDWLQHCQQLFASLTMAREAQTETDALSPLQAVLTEPENSRWLHLVEQARQAIHAGALAKVVPARHLRFQSSCDFQPRRILQKLTRQFPACTVFGIAQGGATLVAATPEKLVRLRNGRIYCDALGGTMPCSDSPAQNQILQTELMQSSRIRREHALVVDQMARALAPLCTRLQLPKTPAIMPLRQLQHLWTPIEAQARSGINLLDIAARLHPTPAVAGTPTAAAQHWIREHEPFSRGWYTGAAGWLEADGSGELSVILRCALLRGRQADLYAGAGVVADSDPQSELAETDLKLASLLGVLGEAGPEHGDNNLTGRSPRAAG